MSDMDQNFPLHKEPFDVVLLKRGVNSLDASTGDFKRISVEASDPLSAQMHGDVAKEKDYQALFAVPPGVASDPEIQARRREMEGPAVDRSKI
jgi:hypothetical protein